MKKFFFAGRPVVQAVQNSVSAREVFSRPVRRIGAGAARLPGWQAFYRDWADAAQQTVAILRTEAGRAPRDRALTAPASRSSAIPSSATLTSATKLWG